MRDSSPTRIAVVTGAGSGIGAAVALALAGGGWHVVLAGRRLDALASVAERGAGLPGELHPEPTDVTDEASVRSLFDQAVEAYGRVDLLFNNAGTGAPGRDLDDPAGGVERRGRGEPHGCLPLQPGGLPGDAAPAAARWPDHQQRLDLRARPRPQSVAYTATKHAITGLTKSTSFDGRAFDIACGQIDIGNAATEMTERMTEAVPQADGSARPEPRIDVAHVARAVLYMASLPLDANVATMTVMATNMPYVGRG